jgi:hypothetical protein
MIYLKIYLEWRTLKCMDLLNTTTAVTRWPDAITTAGASADAAAEEAT